MRKKIYYLLVLIVVFAIVSCNKEEDQNETNKQEEMENLLCKSWERTYLTIGSDTNYSENWIFERIFMKDKTFIMNITRLGDPGEDDEFDSDTSMWRWNVESFSAIEIQNSNDDSEWFYSRIPKLTDTELVLEQDRDNNQIYRFHFVAK
jgi:uncharacterized lipoprotein NlpE involved in copper resistance